MKRSAASLAIVSIRFQKEAHVLLLAVAACAFVAYLQRHDDAFAMFAGALVFGTLSGVGAALLMRGGKRYRELDICEQAAPLYGRELARATAVMPCTIAACAVVAYWIVAAIYLPPATGAIATTVLGTCAATLIALVATLARGARRTALIGLACMFSPAIFAVAALSMLAAAAISLAAAFVALREYGEALARYDPV